MDTPNGPKEDSEHHDLQNNDEEIIENYLSEIDKTVDNDVSINEFEENNVVIIKADIKEDKNDTEMEMLENKADIDDKEDLVSKDVEDGLLDDNIIDTENVDALNNENDLNLNSNIKKLEVVDDSKDFENSVLEQNEETEAYTEKEILEGTSNIITDEVKEEENHNDVNADKEEQNEDIKDSNDKELLEGSSNIITDVGKEENPNDIDQDNEEQNEDMNDDADKELFEGTSNIITYEGNEEENPNDINEDKEETTQDVIETADPIENENVLSNYNADDKVNMSDSKVDIEIANQNNVLERDDSQNFNDNANQIADSVNEQNNSNDINIGVDDNNNTALPRTSKPRESIILGKKIIDYDYLPQSYMTRQPVSALTPVFSFGYNRYVPIINLSTEKRCFIFYSASHLAIVFDYFHNEQMVLQGHSNSITCTTASKDKRWLGTGDTGEDSVVIIWDCNTGLPVRTMFEPHPNGVVAIALTPDARYLATLSAENKQTFAVWDWTNGDDVPLCSASLSIDYGIQRYIVFNEDDIFHVATNSETQVLFYQWDKVGNIKYFAPSLTKKDFNKEIGKFSNTVYLPKTTKAITATSQGLLVVWEGNNPLVKVSNESTPDKRAVKLVPVHQKGINVLTLIDSYIVTGDVAGQIKFFDFNFMLMFWYQDWNFGAITSISPSNDIPIERVRQALDNSEYPDDATIAKNKFYLRDFIVGTISTIFATVKVEGSKIKIIFREHDQSVFSAAAHPSLPLVATGSYSGLLKIWDYEQKRSLKTRQFDKVPIKCLCFDHRGIQLAVGFTNGEIRILDTHALKDVTKSSFHFSKVHITHILFSEHSEFLATVDANCTTTLFRPGQGEHEEPWVYVARYRAHYKPVVDLMFGRWFDTEVPRLFTLGQDRRLVEYDLVNATEDNLPIVHELRIEQRAVPLTMCWYPEEDKEGFMVTANDEYKLKMYNHHTKMCRFTYLGPTFGSPVKILKTLPPGETHPMMEDGYRQRYVAYANQNKIGLMRLPFDGNPYNYMTMIAHPKGVTNLCCSYDGNYLISVGEDFIVTVWRITVDILETQARLGGSDMAPYYELIEGGEFGMFMHELKDYFYYSMIRTQGIDSLQTRKVDVVIEISEVPYIMRGIGFYPSEEEIENMLNELKFRDFYKTGECATKVNLDTFLKLYINHRPAFGIQSSKIDEAFRNILQEERGELTNERFLDLLINRGENILEEDLAEYLATLLGLNPLGGSLEMEDFDPNKVKDAINEFLPKVVTSKNFIEDMLCMKIVDKESLLSTKVRSVNKAANGTQT